MEKIIVEGGRALNGEVRPQGSKNAALPMLFATIAVNGVSYIHNLPDIGDVAVAIEILKGLGARVQIDGDLAVIDTVCLKYRTPDRALVRRIRASSYLLGACLSRFGEAEFMEFGGCNFDLRPIDLHVLAAEKLGARIDGDRLIGKKLKGAEIIFEKASVGATINAIIMAASAEGNTVIRGGAREPHVHALIEFLRSAGANITEGDDGIFIKPGMLHGARCTVIPDTVELGTYLLLGPLTGGSISTCFTSAAELEYPLKILETAGVCVKSHGGLLTVEGELRRSITVETAPYPGYPTDLQPQIAPLMARFCGGEITEHVWSGRFGYLEQLCGFGVKYDRAGNRVKIFPSRFTSAKACATDLRGGAACVMCALAAEGRSEIYSPEIIFRGYSSMIEKLRLLGADLWVK